MITDIDCRSETKNLDRNKVKPYWNDYFSFERDAPGLHELTAAALRTALDDARTQPSPFMDAQRTISEILTDFGHKHNFHRQFNERFGAMKPSVLGEVLGTKGYAYLPASTHFRSTVIDRNPLAASGMSSHFLPSGWRPSSLNS